jgi:hypothetical protein
MVRICPTLLHVGVGERYLCKFNRSMHSWLWYMVITAGQHRERLSALLAKPS